MGGSISGNASPRRSAGGSVGYTTGGPVTYKLWAGSAWQDRIHATITAARGGVLAVKPIYSLILLVVLFAIGLGVSLFVGPGLPVLPRIIIFVVGVSLSALLYYWQFYRPFLSIRDDYARPLLQHLFDSLIRDCKKVRPGDYDLRTNVMKVRKKYLGLGKRYLKFDFWVGDYSPAELEQRYKEDVACCGTALRENEQVVFDSETVQEPFRHMSETQRDVTRNVRSILSTPVYRANDETKKWPVAILNIDSASAIAVTGFDESGDDDPRAKTAEYAELMGPILS